MLTDFTTLLSTVVSIISGLTVVLSFTRRGRAFWTSWWQNRKDKKAMPKLVKILVSKVGKIERETKTNGGSSIKDEVRLLVSERLFELQESPFPAFRCSPGGNNIFANRAYETLCNASDETLMGLGWRQYVFDEHQGDDYFARWLEVAQTGSHFAGNLKFKNSQGDYRGEWLVRIVPLGPHKKYEQVWGGRFFPVDEVARKVAAHYGWPMHQRQQGEVQLQLGEYDEI